MIHLISIVLLAIPFLIVGLWRSRPVFAFIIASLILILGALAPVFYAIITIFDAMALSGSEGAEAMSGLLAEAVMQSVTSSIIWLAILALFQFIIRRIMRNRDSLELNTELKNT